MNSEILLWVAKPPWILAGLRFHSCSSEGTFLYGKPTAVFEGLSRASPQNWMGSLLKSLPAHSSPMKPHFILPAAVWTPQVRTVSACLYEDYYGPNIALDCLVCALFHSCTNTASPFFCLKKSFSFDPTSSSKETVRSSDVWRCPSTAWCWSVSDHLPPRP